MESYGKELILDIGECVEDNKPAESSKVLPSAGVGIYVKNYLEAVGVIQACKAGVTIESVMRPF